MDEDTCSVKSKLERSETEHCTIRQTKLNILPDDTLLRDIDELSVVWLDSNIHRSEDCIFTELELRRFFGNVRTFNDFNDCVNYLTVVPNEHDRVFLVVSGALADDLLKRIETLEAIVWIYIFCEHESPHAEWAKKHEKIRGVFVEQASLFARLQPDIATYSIHLTPMRIFQTDNKQKSICDLNEQTASFMWFQLLIQIILTMGDNRDARAKKDLIDTCRKRYEGNTLEQQRITEFENDYKSDRAIYWYTKDSFLYRSINRAFRSRDIDIIYQFRFIIAEIHEQLAGLPRPSTTDLTVYRGQYISTAEIQIIESNQEKGFIAMNTFLSTSKQYVQAAGFSVVETETKMPRGLESVVYQITVDQTRQPFAYIGALSAIPTEDEILFSVGTVFRIDNVEKWSSSWLVCLTLTTEVEEQFDALFNHFLDEIGQKPTLAMLGKFLMMQGDYNRAQRYFQFIIEENGISLSDDERVICYMYLANIMDDKGEYEKAMDYHQKILNIQQHRFGIEHPYVSQIYNNMASVQMALGQYGEAAKNFQHCLSIDLQCESQDKRGIATSYNNVALAYNIMGDHSKAEANYKKTLDIQLELGLDTDKSSDIAITYHNLGSLYDDLRQYAKAIYYYKKALDIKRASLPPEHPSHTTTESSLAMVYFQLNKHKLALKKCLAVLDVKLKTRPPNFPSLAKTYINLGSIYHGLGDFTRAEEQYKTALQIYESHLPKNHSEAGKNHKALGDLYDAMGETGNALKHYQKAFDIFQHQEPLNLTALGQAYIDLGSIEKNLQKAIEYLKQGMATLLSADVIDQRSLAFAYNDLGLGHRRTEQLEDAIMNYKKAIDIGLELVNHDENDPLLSTFYHNLGSAFFKQGKVKKGLDYIHKALDNQLKTVEPFHPTLGEIYNDLGSFYNELEKRKQAVEFYQKAIEVYKQPNSQSPRLLATMYVNIGIVYENKNKWKKAVGNYKMALDLQRKDPEPDDPDLILTYSSLGSIYADRGKYAIALTYFNSMLKIQESIPSSRTLELADAYDEVATCYCSNKQYQCAAKLFKKSLKIRRQKQSPLAFTYSQLAYVYERLGKLKSASNNYEIAIKHIIEEGEKEKNDDYYEDLCGWHKNLGIIQGQLKMLDEALGNLKRSLALYDEFLANDSDHDELRRNILKAISQVRKTNKKQH